MPDADIESTANALLGAAFGAAENVVWHWHWRLRLMMKLQIN